MEYSVVIVDDHLLIAKAIGSIIEQFNHFKVLYECENGKVLTDKLSNKKNIPDIILLDISMPIMDGFETSKWLKENHPQVMVLALSMQGDDASLFKMIRCGARGYLHKNVHPIELAKALETVVKNGYYYPEWATNRLLHSISEGKGEESSLVPLSEREKEFLPYTCTEMTYKEIAEKMFCSPRTVESYRDSLFEKLGVKTRVALALYAVKIGLFNIK